MRDFFWELSRRAVITGARPAIVAPGRTLSYQDLLSRIRAGAEWAQTLPNRVGLLFGDAAEYLLADLALSFAGKELVPLPAFFSDAQLAHILATAALSHVVSDEISTDRARRLGLVASELGAEADCGCEPAADARRIIFTSGSTGRPKGVRLSSRQVLASTAALAEATGASADDRYLSLLPSALLLEQIAGIYVPLLVGASVHLPRGSLAGPHPGSIAGMVDESKATGTVLVPELLMAWLRELAALDRPAPPSLKYVAVGGAPVPERLASAAWARGLPVYQGYGLSECCSVVCVNRAGDPGLGTVGRPLAGVRVAIEDGEIVVGGSTVMDGYLDEPLVDGSWRTGDLGGFDPDGRLIVKGRKDNVIVTSAGRNVSPEWVEDLIAADPRIKHCVVVEHDGALAVVITPADKSITACTASLRQILADTCRTTPDYARPRQCLVLSDREFRDLDLLTPNGRPRRSAIRAVIAERSRLLAEPLT
jgi:long-subunit acyl-CoA synthetase (AMP-forming)